MTIKNKPLKWFGGKHYLAKRIIALMPPHIHYVEPFFGGGHVLLEKNPEGVSEVVNDLHGDLINFWKVLQDEKLFKKIQRILRATPFSQEEHRTANATLLKDTDKVKRAAAFFVKARQSRSGRSATFTGLRRKTTRQGMNGEVSAWINSIDCLPAIHTRLMRVVIYNDDALKVIKREDTKNTLFYLDPPYVVESRQHGAGEIYDHDFTGEDHVKLLDLLQDLEGKFILSGYPNRLYGKYKHQNKWRTTDFDVANSFATYKNNQKPRLTERVWMNY